MFTSVRAKEPDTGRITCRSYDLVRDAVCLTRMAPGTVLVLGPAVGVVAQAVAVAITWPEWLRVEHEVAVLVGIPAQPAHPALWDRPPPAPAPGPAPGTR